MIKLNAPALPASAAKWLTRWQQDLAAIGDYAQRVSEADRKWSQRRSNTKTMRSVAEKLAEMSSGVGRCNYCEDSAGYQIEHIDPKSFYPDKTFDWENMLFACGWFNGPKNNQHAIFEAATGGFLEVVRDEETGVVPPPAGDSVLINPRREDPQRFFHLDLLDTFVINVRSGLAPRDRQRAEYTRCVLRFNHRDALVQHRRVAYENYLALLERYIRLRDNDEADEKRQRTISALRRGDHRYVWLEMKRQRTDIDELRQLFDQAPEALDW